MSSLRLVVGIIWLTLLFVTHAIWTATALPLDDSPDFTVSGYPELAELEADLDVAPPLESPRRVDIYGNEVESAMTDYRIDVRGDLYERHAPQTALPDPARAGT